jgi:hypothetical protein
MFGGPKVSAPAKSVVRSEDQFLDKAAKLRQEEMGIYRERKLV